MKLSRSDRKETTTCRMPRSLFFPDVSGLKWASAARSSGVALSSLRHRGARTLPMP